MAVPASDALRSQAREHLRALALGLHPKTGERVHDAFVLHDVDVVRSLLIALESLEGGEPDDENRAGKPWSASEDRELETSFKNGAGLDEIAANHRRRVGGVVARLVHLKIVPSRDEARAVFARRGPET